MSTAAATSGNSADVAALVGRARHGQHRAIAQLISLVENESAASRAIAEHLSPDVGRAHVIGLTGAPGVGKSTTTSSLIDGYRAQGKRVAVLAIDPSSPFTGGALLGDRIRMGAHATDQCVFIRSMSSRGQLGGLAAATPQAVRVLDAAGFDIVLVETVGVGQAEIDIAGLADSTIVLVAPGMGDGIQAAKAGIIEIADLFVVNKADRDGAARTVRELRSAIGYTPPSDSDSWVRPVISASALNSTGIDQIVVALADHRRWLSHGDRLRIRRERRSATEITALVLTEVKRLLDSGSQATVTSELAKAVAAGSLDPFGAADQLLKEMGVSS
ncbi:MAG: methylmalonyl Co-A mutase-associated GTPase MeaB [Antricoccus sp.]